MIALIFDTLINCLTLFLSILLYKYVRNNNHNKISFILKIFIVTISLNAILSILNNLTLDDDIVDNWIATVFMIIVFVIWIMYVRSFSSLGLKLETKGIRLPCDKWKYKNDLIIIFKCTCHSFSISNYGGLKFNYKIIFFVF